ncbi:MAG: chondroitin lyase [Sediminibacterium sp.]|nr:chondroitin lyase [Sediminibacterium sp.]
MKKLLLIFLLQFSLITSAMAQFEEAISIQKKIVSQILSNPASDGRVEGILTEMESDGSFRKIDYSDLSTTAGFPQGRHTTELCFLSRVYNNPQSIFFNNQRVLAAIETGLRFWIKNDFVGDNWHDNQISTPSNLVDLMLVVGDKLPAELVQQAQPIIGRANLNASGARPSGDRIVIAGILAKNMLFNRRYASFDTVLRVIQGEMKFSTGERGLQHDYSFHHRVDRVNNTDSYGYGKFANVFGEWAWYVAGTHYQFAPEKVNQLIDYYIDGIFKQMVYGVYDDVSVKNRSITGKQGMFQPKGVMEIERMLAISNYRRNELEDIILLRKGLAKPTLSFAKFFWQSEHFVFQRPNFYTTVRMFSTRNQNMEQPYNGPGKTTHHRADGTNYLVLKGDEYFNIWAVYDWQKISGTTIQQKKSLPPASEIQKEGLTSFVGAVTDGLYGAVAFDFISPHDLLEAKKSWFFFDEEYVCLGAGIRPKKSLPVITTINQVLLKSEVRIFQDQQEKIVSPGNNLYDKVKWAYQDKIGYIFPQPANIHISNKTEQGRWSDITDQKNISKELVQSDVFSIYFNHSDKSNPASTSAPDAATSYQYIVVPDITPEKLKQTASNNRNIQILSNTPELQGVRHTKLEMLQLAFYKAGEIEIAPGKLFRMDSQGMALIKMKGNALQSVTVSDPSRYLKRLLVTIPGLYVKKGNDFICVPDAANNQTMLIINLPTGVYAGKSVTILL